MLPEQTNNSRVVTGPILTDGRMCRMTAAASASPDRSTVLGKVLVVLHAFRADDDVVSLAELGRRTELPKTTLHRVAADLVQARLLDKLDGGYRLGGQLFELGMRASVERGLLEVAIPFMQDLYERTHETVHLGIREGIEVVYVEKIGGHRQAATPSRVGGRMPLYCTGLGKALLAYAPHDVLEQVVAAGLRRLTPRTIIAPGMPMPSMPICPAKPSCISLSFRRSFAMRKSISLSVNMPSSCGEEVWFSSVSDRRS